MVKFEVTVCDRKYLDDQGRCCGRKPILYKRPEPYRFCARCDAAFNMLGEQTENWAWKITGNDEFTRKRAIVPNAATKDTGQ